MFDSGDVLPSADRWTSAGWTARAAPANADSVLSIGVAVASGGTVTVDDLAVSDAGPPPPSAGSGRNAAFGPRDGVPDAVFSAAPAAAGRFAHDRGWLVWAGVGALLLLAYAGLMFVDRRLGKVHLSTRRGRAVAQVGRQDV